MPALSLLLPFLSVLGSVCALPANHTSADLAPRISEVLEYLEANGGVNWTQANGTRYTIHTYKEWAAAERALIDDDTTTFIGSLASGASPSGASPSNNKLSSALPSSSPKASTKRDSKAHYIKGGIALHGVSQYAYSYCFESGQWGATSAFSDFVPQACNAIMNRGVADRVITWHSQGYHQPDHNVAAWFIQQSGKGGLSIDACQQIFDGFKDGGVPKGEGPWCAGTGTMGKKDGPGMTQGGYVRWYTNTDGSWFVGSEAGQLKIDPNECFSSGKPCSNINDVATIQSN